VPKPNEGAEDVAPPAPPPKPPPAPKRPGLVSPLGLLRLPPNGVDDAPEVAPGPKRPLPGLLAGVFDAPPNGLDALAFPPPPNRPPGVPEPALAVPKRPGVDWPEVLVVAPPNSGCFGVLPCCPKLKDMLRGGVEWMRAVWW
jgi:hypothetical protein